MGRLVKTRLPGAAGSVPRLDPRFWHVNFDFYTTAAVVTRSDSNGLIAKATLRRKNAFAGLIWTSAPLYQHPVHAYQENHDYTGLNWAFALAVEDDAPDLSADRPIGMTIEAIDGRAWFIRLWDYRADPSDTDPRTQSFYLQFTPDLLIGSPSTGGPPEGVDTRSIARILISIVGDTYDPASADPFETPQEVTLIFGDMSVSGRGATLPRDTRPLAAHGVGMTDGYDNAYPATPEQIVESVWQLGYRGDFVMYAGISKFPRWGWDGARWLVDDAAEDPLSPPARLWWTDFCARLAARGFKLWVSVSFELLALMTPDDWSQRNSDGTIARTGWEPPSTLLSPCVDAARHYLAKVAIALLSIAEAAGLAPRYQIGEPWWWDGSYTGGGPCIYDAATEAAYVAATGQAVPTPRLDTVYAPVGIHEAYLEFCRDKLGALTLALRDAVLSAFPAAQTAILVFSPQALNPLSAITAILNLPLEQWDADNFDILQIEDYDWLTADRFDLVERTWTLAGETLGYPRHRTEYFAGFNLEAKNQESAWPLIDKGVTLAVSRARRVWVWSREQVLRDGWLYDPSVNLWESLASPRLAPVLRWATLWTITPTVDQALHFTDHPHALVHEGVTWDPAGGGELSALRRATDLYDANRSLRALVTSERITEADLAAGRWDGASVTERLVDWRFPWRPAIETRTWSIGRLTHGRGAWEAELVGPAARLKRPVGLTVTATCRHLLGDAGCKVDIVNAHYAVSTVTGSATLGNARDSFLTGLAGNAPDGWYAFGVLTFTSGANAGLSREVKTYGTADGRVTLRLPFPWAVAVGDAFRVTAGCDRTVGTCRAKFDNVVNFGGFPFSPGSRVYNETTQRAASNGGGGIGS